MHLGRIVAITTVLMIGFGSAALAGVLGPHVCDTDFVADKIGDKNWIILDGRDGADYEKGHIPGAVNYGKPVVVVLKHPVDGRVVPVQEAEQLLSAIGMTNDKGLIVYGKKGDYHVTVEQLPVFLGIKEFYYVDGGYEAWVAAGEKVETGKVSPVPGNFKAKIAKPDLYVSTKEMMEIVKNKSPKVTLIDTRSVAEYVGEENTTLRGGRIPGAINIPVDRNIDPNTGKFLPKRMLADIYKDIPKDNKIILYCHRGCRTGFPYYALQMLGYNNIAVYEDSYIVWGARSDTPVEHEHYTNVRPIVSGIDALKARVEKLEKDLEAIKRK